MNESEETVATVLQRITVPPVNAGHIHRLVEETVNERTQLRPNRVGAQRSR
jgi:hypothetical protein